MTYMALVVVSEEYVKRGSGRVILYSVFNLYFVELNPLKAVTKNLLCITNNCVEIVSKVVLSIRSS